MNRQRGYAVAILLVLMIMGALALLVGQLGALEPSSVLAREVRSRDALQEAKAALIAWAARHPDRPGALPCPDRLNNDGLADEPCDAANQRVGRLPWRTLNMTDLRDSTGERLWYAVATTLRDQTVYPGPFAVNPYSFGDIRLCALGSACTAGNPQQELGAQLAALVIAPGAPLAGQDRSPANANLAVHFLEQRNNTTGDTDFDFGPAQATFNDAVLAISMTDVFDATVPIVAARVGNEIVPIIRGAYDPAQLAGGGPRWAGLPYAVQFSDPTPAGYPFVFAPVDTALANEGLIPVTNQASAFGTPDPNRLRWTTVSYGMSAGVPTSPTCTGELPGTRENQCTITVTAGGCQQFEAMLANVGRSFAEPYTLADIVSTTNVTAAAASPGCPLAVLNHSILSDSTGSVSVRFTPTDPSLPVVVRFAAPRYIATLTTQVAPFPAPTAWFMSNQWYRNVYYAIAPAPPPLSGLPRWPCTTGVTCLTIDLASAGGVTQVSNRNGVVAMMGPIRLPMPLGLPAANLPASYLEGSNANLAATPRLFASRPPRTDFNDVVVAVHP